MIRVVGSICILIGGGAVWLLKRRERRRELETMLRLQTDLHRLREEIRQMRTPIPKVIGKLASASPGEAGRFWRGIKHGLASGGLLADAWREALQAAAIPEEPEAILVKLAEDLCGDEENICKAISLACDEIGVVSAKWRRELPDRERRNGALCFSASALLVILLL